MTPNPLPAARTCASRRNFTLTLQRSESLRRDLRGARLVGATVLDAKERVIRRVKARRDSVRVDLRGLPKGRFILQAGLRLRTGRQVTIERQYRTCEGARA